LSLTVFRYFRRPYWIEDNNRKCLVANPYKGMSWRKSNKNWRRESAALEISKKAVMTSPKQHFLNLRKVTSHFLRLCGSSFNKIGPKLWKLKTTTHTHTHTHTILIFAKKHQTFSYTNIVPLASCYYFQLPFSTFDLDLIAITR